MALENLTWQYNMALEIYIYMYIYIYIYIIYILYIYTLRQSNLALENLGFCQLSIAAPDPSGSTPPNISVQHPLARGKGRRRGRARGPHFWREI